jgi:hypothetical protein
MSLGNWESRRHRARTQAPLLDWFLATPLLPQSSAFLVPSEAKWTVLSGQPAYVAIGNPLTTRRHGNARQTVPLGSAPSTKGVPRETRSRGFARGSEKRVPICRKGLHGRGSWREASAHVVCGCPP